MPKAKNKKAAEAEALYHKGMKLVDIASKLDVPAGTVRRWKSVYKWSTERTKKKTNVRKKGGAPFGNKNATGPPGNKNAEKYGFFSKYLPPETKEIFDSIEQADPLDLLWHQIQISYAAIIRAQKIAYVKNQEDKTVELISCGKKGDTYQVEQAWEKQNNFLKAQARAQGELTRMIKQYDEMLHNNWDNATEEQKSRIEKMKAETARIKGEEFRDRQSDDGFIDALKGKAVDVWQE